MTRVLGSKPAVGACLLLLLAFLLVTQRPGHDWGDDFSLYILHARNIAAGRSYADTGYVYDTEPPAHSPPTYPPVFPLLLAPLYKAFGLNYRPMKTLIDTLLVLSLLPLYGLARRHLPKAPALLLIAFTGLNYFYLYIKDWVTSDSTYLFFSFGALYLVSRAHDLNKSASYAWGLAAGLGAALSYGTRSVGLSLFLAMIGCELLRYRRGTRFLMAATCAFGLYMLVSNALIHRDSGYLNQLALSPSSIRHIGFRLAFTNCARNLWEYFKFTSYAWINGYSTTVQVGLFFSLSAAAIFAFWRQLRQRSMEVGDLYIVFYLALLVLYGTSGLRYLVPVIPLYLIYAFRGLELARASRARWIRSAVVSAYILIMLTALGSASRVERGPIGEGVNKPTFLEVCDFVRQHTAADSLLVCWKPRLMVLYTERRAVRKLASTQFDNAMPFFQRLHADYLILYLGSEEDRKWLAFVERSPATFRVMHENADFKVFRINRGDS